VTPSTYLITGSSTGIGEATALRLDRAGHRVFAGVRKQEDADRLAKEASDRLVPLLLDVTEESQIREAAQALEPDGLDGLVNNAGIGRGGPLEFLPIDEWRTQFDVNVFGQIALTRALLPFLRRSKGRVVFVGSIGGRVGGALFGPYSGSKFALEGIAESLRHEVDPLGVSVSMVEPGAVRTRIWEKGRSEADRLEEELPDEAGELYGEQFERLREGFDESERRGVDPDVVAKVIERALTSPRPRHRYLVGPDAILLGSLDRVLPHSAKHWAVTRLSRLSTGS
jgi:NAD(P)-dependent dehydrogenase (short-subunit alcohol dehydrogenase family)